jgi:hypothetical protein
LSQANVENHAAAVCRCQAPSVPLCGFCEDDLYCPQCGSEITSVFCDTACPDDGVIWIYPNDRGDFEFSLSLRCRGRDRDARETCPELDLSQSRLRVSNWFERELEQLGPRADGRAMRYRLKPRPAYLNRGTGWQNILPLAGVAADLQASGQFQSTTFALRICRSPEFSILFSGNDVLLDAAEAGATSWEVFRSDKLLLDVEFRSNFSPVYFQDYGPGEGPIDVTPVGSFAAWLVDACPAGLRLGPPQQPDQDVVWKTSLALDTTDWEVGDRRELAFYLRGPFGVQRIVHTFHRVAVPDLRYSSQPINIPVLHYGDVLGPRRYGGPLPDVTIENVGEAAGRSNPPRIEWETPPADESMIVAAWTRPDFNGGFSPGDQAELDLTIDASRVPEGQLADRELRARIVLSMDDPQRQWTLPVVIRRVVPRPICQRRVAIDFGNTNTYLAVWSKDDAEQVVPVLTDGDPEQFASAMYFRDVSDPEHPEYVVGPEAVRLGRACPTALVSMLKRWIGEREADGSPPKRYVWDENGRDAAYDVPTLVRLFFRGVLARCEDMLHEKVARIGVSLPTNSSPRRNAAFRAILDDLAGRMTAETPSRQLECAERDIDEATAVTMAFVLDPENLKKEIKSRLADGRRSLVVASVDVGGGTIDTALIRVNFDCNLEHVEFARFGSEYLGLGGDSQFGGDNVTVAILEILSKRLRRILQEVGESTPAGVPELRLAMPGEGQSRDARGNFDVLWNAAELIKFHLCAPDGDGDCVAQSASEGRRVLREQLNVAMHELTARYANTGSGYREQPLLQEPALRERLQEAIDNDELLCTLDEAYRHAIQRDLRGRSGYTVFDRLERCIVDLAGFAGRHSTEIDFIILAGAGSRLPLVQELLAAHLPGVDVCVDIQRAKSKVAYGLVRYFELNEKAPDHVRGLRFASQYTPWPIGLREPGTRAFKQVVPACSPVDDPRAWHPFPEGLRVQDVWNSNQARRIELYCRWGQNRVELLGTFDLKRPGDQSSRDASEPQLPDEMPQDNSVAIRFAGGLEAIELKVCIAGRTFGFWRMLPAP